MAILKNINDVNALLQSKGLAPVESKSYRLTLTPEELAQEEEMRKGTTEQPVSAEQLFIHQVIQEVITHYRLDETPGFYGDDESASGQVQQSIYYQVLNQKGILFEFFKKACHEKRQLDWLTRYDELYVLAVQDAYRLAA